MFFFNYLHVLLERTHKDTIRNVISMHSIDLRKSNEITFANIMEHVIVWHTAKYDEFGRSIAFQYTLDMLSLCSIT